MGIWRAICVSSQVDIPEKATYIALHHCSLQLLLQHLLTRSAGALLQPAGGAAGRWCGGMPSVMVQGSH